MGKMGSRSLKKEIGRLLADENFESGLAAIRRMPPRQAVSPLFGYFCDLDETVKWHAVTAAGALVADLAQSDTESARVVIRRFIWNLNDESGGIGWGCPEAMGEIMARNKNLAGEFWRILISYIRPDGNYLEHEGLQRGALWGVGRLAQARPQLLETSVDYLHPYMQTGDPYLRGLAAWAAGALRNKNTEVLLNALKKDSARLSIFLDGQLIRCSVAELAQKSLQFSKT